MGSRSVAGMLTLLRFVISVLVRRFRRRAVLELENLALRHQLRVLRRQRPGRPRLFVIDRLLWVWLYRLWPHCLEVMVLVKPATVIQWLWLPRTWSEVTECDSCASGRRDVRISDQATAGRTIPTEVTCEPRG
jgi:hypothetical protein